MKLRLLNGILIIDIFTIILILCILLIPSVVVRFILGLPFLLFFPGYTLVCALFVKNEKIDHIQRAALSGVMSIAIVALIGFVLNYTAEGIKLVPVLYSITGFIVVTSIVALIRTSRKFKTNKFTTEYNLSLLSWGGNRFSKSFSIILIISIFVAFGTLGYVLVKPKIVAGFTEFYILGINGKAQDYPIKFTLNNDKVTTVLYSDGTLDSISGFGVVTLGIVNHEQQTMVYSVKMTIDDEPANIYFDGTQTNTLGPLELQQGQKWENQIGIVPQHIGEDQVIRLLLFKGTEITSENSLQLEINVQSTQ